MRSAVKREVQACAARALPDLGGATHAPALLVPGAKRIERLADAKDWWALPCLMLLAFLLRLFLVRYLEQVISPDGVQYVALGHSLIAGNLRAGLSADWPPLYPMLVGIASLFFRDAEFAGRFVSVLAGALLLIPSYMLARAWYGKRAARVCAVIVALHPLLIYNSTTLLTESTYTLLFTYGVLLGWKALCSGKGRAFLLAGATFGACYLLKPEAAGFLLLLLLMIMGRAAVSRPASWKAAARNALLLTVGFMLLAAPYLFYLRQQTGAWTLSGKMASHLWQGSRQAAGDLKPVSFEPLPGAATATAQLVKALRFEYEIFNLIFPPAFVLIAGLGLFRKSWNRRRIGRELYLMAFVAATLAGYAVTLPNIRFLVPLLPILICWLSKGLIEFAGWFAATLSRFKRAQSLKPYVRGFVLTAAVVLLLASLLPLFVYLLRGDKWGDYYGQKRAAEWIKEHGGVRAPIIMSTVPVAAFYAEGHNVELVDEDYAALIARARREKVDYIIVNERDFRYMTPRELMDERSPHAWLRLAFVFPEPLGHKVLVYAVDKGAGVGP